MAAIRSAMKRWPAPVSRKATSAPPAAAPARRSAPTTPWRCRDGQARAAARRRIAIGVADGSTSSPSEGLAQRDVDRDARIAAARVERRADVDAGSGRNCCDSGRRCPAPKRRLSSRGQRRGVDVAGVDERHDPEIADPDPRLEREFGEAAAADRIVEHRIARARAPGSRSRAPSRRRRHRSAATARPGRGSAPTIVPSRTRPAMRHRVGDRLVEAAVDLGAGIAEACRSAATLRARTAPPAGSRWSDRAGRSTRHRPRCRAARR